VIYGLEVPANAFIPILPRASTLHSIKSFTPFELSVAINSVLFNTLDFHKILYPVILPLFLVVVLIMQKSFQSLKPVLILFPLLAIVEGLAVEFSDFVDIVGFCNIVIEHVPSV